MKFLELPENIRQKVIEINRYEWVDHDWWNYGADDSISDALKGIGFTYFKVTGFDLDRGWNATFEFRYEWNPEKPIDLMKIWTVEQDGVRVPQPELEEIHKLLNQAGVMMACRDERFVIHGRDGEYDGAYDAYYSEEEDADFCDSIVDLVDRALKECETFCLKVLEAVFEYLTSDGYIAECLINMDCDYDEDGEEI